jgi:hypothetical protein
MENWHPSMVSEVNEQRQAERRALSAHRAQVRAASRQSFSPRAALAGLLVALAGRLDATGTLAGPASTAPTPGALA